MILVDSSVWIDHFRGDLTPTVKRLHQYLANDAEALYLADLVMLEVLRGIPNAAQGRMIEQTFYILEVVEIAGVQACKRAASKYAKLRAQGFTTKKLADLLIANWCIDENVALLHDDKDFLPFAKLGLRMA
jgi:predicted nucleic acid-binding protein